MVSVITTIFSLVVILNLDEPFYMVLFKKKFHVNSLTGINLVTYFNMVQISRFLYIYTHIYIGPIL